MKLIVSKFTNPQLQDKSIYQNYFFHPNFFLVTLTEFNQDLVDAIKDLDEIDMIFNDI